MGGASYVSSSRNLIVQREDGTMVYSGDNYFFGENLWVSMNNTGTSDQWVMETKNAKFDSGSCTGGTRLANGIGYLITPTSGTSTIQVIFSSNS